jgi:hypothetical protein
MNITWKQVLAVIAGAFAIMSMMAVGPGVLLAVAVLLLAIVLVA